MLGLQLCTTRLNFSSQETQQPPSLFQQEAWQQAVTVTGAANWSPHIFSSTCYSMIWFGFLRQALIGCPMENRLASNSERFTCLWLSSAGIRALWYHAQLKACILSIKYCLEMKKWEWVLKPHPQCHTSFNQVIPPEFVQIPAPIWWQEFKHPTL